MLRLFLHQKLKAGRDDAVKGNAPKLSPKDRRVWNRYSIDHKHLSLLNEQDILLIKDISDKGFATEVAPRGADRMRIGDEYMARIRYHGEAYDIRVKVSWKRANAVGLEIVKSNRETGKFIQRLLKPIKVAASLAEVDNSFSKEGSVIKTWYHGDEGVDFFVWNDEAGEIQAWQLIYNGLYWEWSTNGGLISGKASEDRRSDSVAEYFMSEARMFVPDKSVSDEKLNFISDVFEALSLENREKLLSTLIQIKG